MNRDQLLNLSLTDLSFKELVALFKRRRAVIVSTTLIFIALGTAISLFMTKTYRSGKVIVVEGKTQANPNNSPTSIVDVITQSSVDYDVLTQIQIMNSFNTIYKSLQRIKYQMPAQMTDDEFQKLPKVNVQQIQTTNTVQVSVEDKDPDTAQKLADVIPTIYKEDILDRQNDSVRRSLEFISARIEDERKNLQSQQDEYSNYKIENNVADFRTEMEVRAGALVEARRKLDEAEADLDATIAAMGAAEAQRNSMAKVVDNPTQLTPFDVISRAEEELNTLEVQKESLLVNNAPDSDRVMRIDAMINKKSQYIMGLKDGTLRPANSKIRNPLTDELEKQYLNAKASHDALVAKVSGLKQNVSEREADMRALAPITAKQQELETKLQETETTIQRLLSLQSDVQLRDNAISEPIRDVTGSIPSQLVRPIIPLNLALAAVLGIFFGCVFALVRDVSLDKVNSSNEASLISEKDILGRIPLRASSREPLIADPQRARAFEAYRILRSSIILAGNGKKVFLVTSTLPKEGKSTVAANLAVAMALEGRKTILVDGNLRNPAVHKLFKVDQTKGVTDVLSGSVSLDEALKTTGQDNLAILTAGGEAANPTELVSSAAMKDLVQKLSTQADIVLIDGPSAFGFADTQSLVTAVKDVLYVTQLERPAKTQMREAVGMIDFAGGSVLGLILNKDKWAINRARGGA